MCSSRNRSPEIEHIWNRIFEAEKDINNNRNSLVRHESWINNAYEDIRMLFKHIESLEQRVGKLEKEKRALLRKFRKCERIV